MSLILSSSDILSFLLSTETIKLRMKHFKLNTERNLVPVADLCIADVARTDYPLVMQTFADALHDRHINFSIIVIEDQMLVAKKQVVSWSISE